MFDFLSVSEILKTEKGFKEAVNFLIMRDEELAAEFHDHYYRDTIYKRLYADGNYSSREEIEKLCIQNVAFDKLQKKWADEGITPNGYSYSMHDRCRLCGEEFFMSPNERQHLFHECEVFQKVLKVFPETSTEWERFIEILKQNFSY